MATKVSSRSAPAAKRKAATPKNGLKARARRRNAPASKNKPEHEFKRIVPALPLQEFLDGLTAVGRAIPEKIRREMPTDLSREVDHYLYGTPKRER